MPGQQDPSKTERATPKRIRKARDKGSVAKSQELPKIIVLFVGVMFLYYFVGSIGHELRDVFTWAFKTGFTTVLTPSIRIKLHPGRSQGQSFYPYIFQ